MVNFNRPWRVCPSDFMIVLKCPADLNKSVPLDYGR